MSVVVFISLAANLIDGGITTGTLWETAIGLLVLSVIIVLGRTVGVVVQIDQGIVSLKCTRFFRATFPVHDVVAITNGSPVFTGGYGYRILGKNHRGFIVGGPQVTLELADGRVYTASVPSVEEFRTAMMESR
ncbi:hypothetical protein [Arthrobacter castelli]|uniref:hypothetical protein n=1 Tax=Arthrobacter castelli TaxID=271431 RepID=UPI000422EFF5|nr:hypothetical protein [Arthrobacter castelli]